MNQSPTFEVFFDGKCPLCVREMKWINKLDKNRKIKKTDISKSDFNAQVLEKTQQELMAKIHGRIINEKYPNGKWVTGVEVFRQIYQLLGFAPLVAISRWPVIQQALDMSYQWFAKNRLRLTGRCDTNACHRTFQNTSAEKN